MSTEGGRQKGKETSQGQRDSGEYSTLECFMTSELNRIPFDGNQGCKKNKPVLMETLLSGSTHG